jgi:hypothetical protein
MSYLHDIVSWRKMIKLVVKEFTKFGIMLGICSSSRGFGKVTKLKQRRRLLNIHTKIKIILKENFVYPKCCRAVRKVSHR